MPAKSLEFALMLGYSAFLLLIALLLEWAARVAHQRSLRISSGGFTYHPERDIWRCPRDQQLFPIFADSLKGVAVYRAPASACNSCPGKAACTDSDQGRSIERKDVTGLESGLRTFHRAISLTLLLLSDLILIIELVRSGALYQRIALIGALVFFCKIIERLWTNMAKGTEG